MRLFKKKTTKIPVKVLTEMKHFDENVTRNKDGSYTIAETEFVNTNGVNILYMVSWVNT